jgi:hypothetical protein
MAQGRTQWVIKFFVQFVVDLGKNEKRRAVQLTRLSSLPPESKLAYAVASIRPADKLFARHLGARLFCACSADGSVHVFDLFRWW